MGIYVGKNILSNSNKEIKGQNPPKEVNQEVPKRVTNFPNELTKRLFPDKQQDEILIIFENEFYVGETYSISCEALLDDCHWEVSHVSIVDSTQSELTVKAVNEGTAKIQLYMSDTLVAQRLMNFKIK